MKGLSVEQKTLIKVMIVDDHQLVRVGLKKILAEVQDILVVGEAQSGEEALEIMQNLVPDVILMDVKMPGMGGLEATRRLLRHFPALKIVAVTACDEEPYPTRVLQAGALGYLTKGCGLDEMVMAIRRVYDGQRFISTQVAQLLAIKKLSPQAPFESLSERELQVMLMITDGQNVQAISDKLCLSPKTVNSYRYRLFEKLKVDNDVELTHLAIRYGLMDKDLLDREKD